MILLVLMSSFQILMGNVDEILWLVHFYELAFQYDVRNFLHNCPISFYEFVLFSWDALIFSYHSMIFLYVPRRLVS